MELGMIGLGRMGANMVRRLLKGKHQCVVYDRSAEAVQALVNEGAVGAASLAEFIAKMQTPRAIWLMIPAALVDATLEELSSLVSADDIIIDGGNSYYIDDIRRSQELKTKNIHYVDVGTSGGVWGLERGYCQMIGGEAEVSPKGNFFSRNNMSQHSTPEKKKRRLQHEQQFYPIAYFCQTFGDALMFWAASTV